MTHASPQRTANSEVRTIPSLSAESAEHSLSTFAQTAEGTRECSARETAGRLNAHIGTIARALLGAPNEGLSNKDELRFGNRGSVSVQLTGEKAGQWYDFENSIGGDAIKLIQHHNHCSFREACDWFETNFGLVDLLEPLYPEGADQDDTKKKPKVAKIISESIDVKGTPAELYLQNRGITAQMPVCVQFRYNAHEPYGALVAKANDAEGSCLAVQQIYLTHDGQKASLKVVKRTNKACEGWNKKATVRLPGKQPIVIAEGVETGLSIWQATGQETWVTFGVANFRHAPVPAGAEVIIASDGNAPDSKAADQTRKAAIALKERGVKVLVAEPPQGQDFNDVLVQQGEEAVRQMLAKAKACDAERDNWTDGLMKSREGRPLSVLTNVTHALRTAPKWDGVLHYDMFGNRTVMTKPPPWEDKKSATWPVTPWQDRHDCLATEWMQRHGIMANPATVGQAIETVSRENAFHPVREYLDRLVWDKSPRLDRWLMTYLGAEDTKFLRAVGPRFLISAVARILKPGCQADSALVLEGPQGIRKSSALKVLGGEWFTDRVSDLGSKDAALETAGVWIIELAELDSVTRAESTTIKAFISRRADRFRPPYGKRLVEVPRQCVFAGTINPEGGYLKDPTGARRFWPVGCGTIDLESLERDRDQLWAEAYHRFKNGEPWWLETHELQTLATEEQADRYHGDGWEELIHAWLEENKKDDISVTEVLSLVLQIESSRWTLGDQTRVGRCLTRMGFTKHRPRRPGGGRENRYRRSA